MRKKYKIFSLILSLCMIVTMLPMHVQAASEDTQNEVNSFMEAGQSSISENDSAEDETTVPTEGGDTEVTGNVASDAEEETEADDGETEDVETGVGAEPVEEVVEELFLSENSIEVMNVTTTTTDTKITIPLVFNADSTLTQNCMNTMSAGKSQFHTNHEHADGQPCWAWDDTTDTLTLHNADIETNAYASAYGSIMFKGNAALLLQDGSSNSVKVNSSPNLYVYAINAENDLSILGAGRLRCENLAEGGTSHAIQVQGSLNIDSATVEAVSKKGTGSSPSNGIVSRGPLTIQNNANVTAKGGRGISAVGGMTVDNATVTTDVPEAVMESYSLFVNGNFYLQSGSVMVKGQSTTPRSTFYSNSIGGGNIYLSGGTITVAPTDNNKPFNIEPILANGMAHDTSTGAWNNTDGKACTYRVEAVSTVYSISGTIKGSDTNAGIAAKLQLKDKNGSNVGSAVTANADGTYTIADVQPGTGYTIAISSAGYKNGTITAFDVTDADITGKDLTLTKKTKSSSGGGSAGNDDAQTQTVPPVQGGATGNTRTGNITIGEGTVKAEVDVGGSTIVKITDKDINDAYNRALAEAKKNGRAAGSIKLVLKVTSGSAADSVIVNLPKKVQELVIQKSIIDTIVVVDNPDIQIGIDLQAVKEINQKAHADVNITAVRMDNQILSETAKAFIGMRPVFDFSVTYGNGSRISDFGTGRIEVAIPYMLGRGEKAENVRAVYIDGKGLPHWTDVSAYEREIGILRFQMGHMAVCGIAYHYVNDETQGQHVVAKGDSWWRIARKYNCDMNELAKANGKTISIMLHPGDVLLVP